MRVLIVKMSSLGDIIHTLPAITDCVRQYKKITFDWVVESAFQEIPTWHKHVNRVIPISLRHWRKQKWQAIRQNAIPRFITELRRQQYDYIIDAQGLLKSAIVSRLARGKRLGLSRQCAREPISSFFYDQRISIHSAQHAVERTRQLFARAFGYDYDPDQLSYGIDATQLKKVLVPKPYIVFLHGTTWPSKHWPDKSWCELARIVCESGYTVVMSWGNVAEKARAEAIVEYCQEHNIDNVPIILPKGSLSEMTYVISQAQAAVAVDTGLGHIAAMMQVPTFSLFGPTDPGYTGAYGPLQRHLTVNRDCHPCFAKHCPKIKNIQSAPPCYDTLTPQLVWQHLSGQLEGTIGKKDVSFLARAT